MSAHLTMEVAVLSLTALTLQVAPCAPVLTDTLEMDTTAQVDQPVIELSTFRR